MRQSNKLLIYALLLFVSIGNSNVFAVTAFPKPIKYTQPDGSVITILMKGDERVNWAETLDNYTILPNRQGAYEYAITDDKGNLGLSGIIVNEIEKRTVGEKSFLSTIQKKLFYSKTQIDKLTSQNNSTRSMRIGGFPTTGTRKLLVILANFNNTTPTYTQGNFDNYMNQPNYNNTGSFRDYFIEASYGQLTVNSTVTVWVNLPKAHDYYGPNSKWAEFAYDAVVAADNQANIDFSEFDNDGNGIVDGIAIFHQGRGQEESGNPGDIWSHNWELSATYSTAQRTFDGVVVDAYTTMPERNASGMGTIGVMCHEFGHNLGAPDFYDVNYGTGGQYSGTGDWDLQAGGSWNGISGNKPAHPNPYTKAYIYNWTNPVVLDEQQKVTLRSAHEFPDVVRYNTKTNNEYFLCENRQQMGFDQYIPGHGLLVFHVDGNFINNNYYNINAGQHQGMYPVCAIASGNPPSDYGMINSSGCPFPGTGNRTTFTDETTPHAKSWAGVNTEKPLLEIAENNITKEVTFCFIDCAAPNDPINFSATAAGSSAINLVWEKNALNNPVMIVNSPSGIFGKPTKNKVYQVGDTIGGGGNVLYIGGDNNFEHTNLSANTTYYYKAFSVLAENDYSRGVMKSAKTWCDALTTLPWTENFETVTQLPDCWTIIDNANSGHVWAFGSLSGINLTPNFAYLNSIGFGGESTQNTDLISPIFDFSNYSNINLSFKHYYRHRNSTASVFYSIDYGATWVLIDEFKGTTANPATYSKTISELSGKPNVQFKWNYTGKSGFFWAIDEITITSKPAPTLAVTPETQSVSAEAGTFDFNVTSNSDWTVASDQDWCTVTQNGSGNGTLTATFEANPTTTTRVAKITVSTEGIEPVVVQIQQDAGLSTKLNPLDNANVFPNPTADKFYISTDLEKNLTLEVSIYSTDGRLVLSKTCKNNSDYEFNLENLPKGVYIVKIVSAEGQAIRNIVKM